MSARKLSTVMKSTFIGRGPGGEGTPAALALGGDVTVAALALGAELFPEGGGARLHARAAVIPRIGTAIRSDISRRS
jgi:hypothetical protein